ncbi:MAG: Cys-tRNA(Pro) deacylase [Propionibacteriaceae bacterium]
MAKKQHSVRTSALGILARSGVTFREHYYDHDPAEIHFGDETAAALKVARERLFKTLVVTSERNLAVGVVPVSGQLDLKSLAKTLGYKKVDMADPAVAQRATGYLVGGISPLGLKTSLPIVIDNSVLDYDTIFVSGGRRGLQVELSGDDLVTLTRGIIAMIRR